MCISEISEIDREWNFLGIQNIAGNTLIDFGQFVCQLFFWSCENLALELIQPKDDRVFAIFRKCIAAFLFTVAGIISFTGWIVGSGLKMAGVALSGKNFSYRQGEGKQCWSSKGFSLLSFNVCMYESGFPMLLGGVMPASLRIAKLAQLIRELNADVVVLQELSLGPSELLMKEIKENYPHFYTHIGPLTSYVQHTTIGPELFIATKSPIVSEPKFIPYQNGVEKMGFFCLETPSCWIINAHFPEKEQKAALLQISQQIQILKEETAKPCILAGDLNYRKEIPEKLFYDAKEFLPTCTNLLSARMFGKEDPELSVEVDDFVLVDRVCFEERKMGIKKIETLDLPDWENPWKSLSDHKPIFSEVWTDLLK